MKSIKMFGLAALAALMAMAFVGASSAMAEGSTALCLEDASPCPSGQLISHVHESTSSKATLLSSLDTVLCDVLYLGDVTTANNLGNPLAISGNFTYTNCVDHESRSCSATQTSANATISVLRLGSELADITGSAEVLVECGAFIHCKYNGVGLTGHGLGPLTTGPNGETRLEEQTTNKVSGFLCPKTAKLDILTTPLQATYISS